MTKALLKQALDYSERQCGNLFNAEYNPCESRELAIALQSALDAIAPVGFSQFLSDVHTAAGLISHGKRSIALGKRLSGGVMTYMGKHVQPAARDPLTEEQINIAWINATEVLNMTSQVERFARSIEALHGIGVKP